MKMWAPVDFEPNEVSLDWAAEEYPEVDPKVATRKLECMEFDPPRDDWQKAWREQVLAIAKAMKE